MDEEIMAQQMRVPSEWFLSKTEIARRVYIWLVPLMSFILLVYFIKLYKKELLPIRLSSNTENGYRQGIDVVQAWVFCNWTQLAIPKFMSSLRSNRYAIGPNLSFTNI